MCKTDGGKFKSDVANHPVVTAINGRRLFSMAHEFAAQWHAFQSDDLAVDTLSLTLPQDAFPPNVAVKMDSVTLKALLGVDEDGALVDVTNGFTNRTNESIPPMPLDTDSASPRFTFKAKGNFNKSSIANLLVLVTYEGDLRGED